MTVHAAIAAALAYVDGLKEGGCADGASQAQALLEHLATNGFVVRPREGAERLRLEPGVLDRKNITGLEIRTMRLRVGLTLEALAGLSGVSGAAIHRWEAGRAQPHAAKLAAVMDALARSASDGAAGSEDPDGPRLDMSRHPPIPSTCFTIQPSCVSDRGR